MTEHEDDFEETLNEETPTILNELSCSQPVVAVGLASRYDPNPTGSFLLQPFRAFQDQSESVLDELSGWRCVELSVTSRLLDLVQLAVTLILCLQYHLSETAGRHQEYLLTLLLFLIPALLYVLLSVGRAICYLVEVRNIQTHLLPVSTFVWLLPLFVIFPQIAAYCRWHMIATERKAENAQGKRQKELWQKERKAIIRVTDEITLFYLTAALIQNSAQFLLQFFLLNRRTVDGIPSQATPTVGFQKFAVAWYLLCLVFAATVLEDSFLRISWRSVLITIWWKMFSLLSRMVILGLCLTVSLSLFAGLCTAHCLLFALLVAFKVRSMNCCQRICLSPCLGVLYFVNDFNLRYSEKFPHRALFYVLSFVEGTVVMVSWVGQSDDGGLVWRHYWVSVVTYIAFFVGVLFLRFRYEYNYSKFHPRYIRGERRLLVYVFNCCLSYPEYDLIKIDSEDQSVEQPVTIV